MSYTLDLNKLVKDLMGPQRKAALKAEVEKLAAEMNRLKESASPKAQARLKTLEGKYHSLMKSLHEAQGQLDQEVKKTMTMVKKQAAEVEQNLARYKKLALAQKAKVQKLLSSKKGKSKTSKKKTSKKAAAPKA